MGAKVLKVVLVTVGVIVVALLGLIAVYVIGYSLFAIFTGIGVGTGAARGVGAGIVALVALFVLAVYFRSRRAAAAKFDRHAHRNRAA